VREYSFLSIDEQATAAFARGLALVLRGGDVVLLRGDLGAGKTTLTRGLAASLGVAPGLVSSPTFVIMNQYPIVPAKLEPAKIEPGKLEHAKPGAARELVHVDAYRLNSVEDLESIGWDRVVTEAGVARADAIVVVEWPEKIADAFRALEHGEVRLEAEGPSTARRITVSLPESWSQRVGAEDLLSRPPIECRTTGRWVEPTAKSYPFADQRAQMADLNKWFTGGYKVSRPATQADFDE